MKLYREVANTNYSSYKVCELTCDDTRYVFVREQISWADKERLEMFVEDGLQQD